MKKILKDANQRNDLFDWFGSIDANVLEKWLTEKGLTVPKQLRKLWELTGGGELFESETILGPFGDEKSGDNFELFNEFEHVRGLPQEFFVFHFGLGGLTAFRQAGDEIYQLSGENYHIKESFRDLDEWYEKVIRNEYANRYGLETQDR